MGRFPEIRRETILWRNGPPEKPVLCNACGSRWRVRRTLDGYIPRHANREIQSYQLHSEMKPACDDQKLEVGVDVSGQDGSSACLEEEMNNISSLGSAGSSSGNCMQMEEISGEADKDPLWNPDSVPRRKRSKLRQHILSPVERLQRQLYNNLQEPDFENISADDENILIYARNKYIPPNEIGLGAKLLVSPTTTAEHSSLSPMAEDNASCSANVPVEKFQSLDVDLSDQTTAASSVLHFFIPTSASSFSKKALKLLGWGIRPSRSCSRPLKQLKSTCSLENLVGVNYLL
ncbi:GATA transcription factor 26-like [Solanum dulcamara]|uniref:GATA transcription factor 26-like n=1 Tax=Solanum dulcamara TaxID=45834 RepID=UPI00248559FF|nr:GATA transcription factor 26-like [Solanum dulcamara]